MSLGILRSAFKIESLALTLCQRVLMRTVRYAGSVRLEVCSRQTARQEDSRTPQASNLCRDAKSVRWARGVALDLQHPSRVLRGVLARPRAKPAAHAQAIASVVIIARRAAPATPQEFAVGAHRLEPLMQLGMQLLLHPVCSAAGRFNRGIGATSDAVCILSQRGRMVAVAGSTEATECPAGARPPEPMR
jgi:hypothetical protein